MQWSRGCGHGPRRVAYELDFLDAVGGFSVTSAASAGHLPKEFCSAGIGVRSPARRKKGSAGMHGCIVTNCRDA